MDVYKTNGSYEEYDREKLIKGIHEAYKTAGEVCPEAAAELTPLRSVRPSYRLLRPRCRENLYPAGTSHFPRPWAGHVRRG